MTNIVTRKGLAFGALVALASTAIAGAPAHAAGELNVVPSAGTSYNALSGTVFNLKTTFAPGFTPSSYAQLVYQIKTDANSAVTYSTGTAAVTAPATSVAASTTAVTAATSGASAVSVNYLGLTNTTTTATSSVEVTAFVDANNDGALTAGEWNTVRTVTFKKVADVNPVVTVAAASTGDTSAKVTVNWGDLNVEQINRSAAYGVATGSTNSSLGVEIKTTQNSTYAAATYASSAFTRGSLTALVAGDVVTAQAVYATNTYVASPVSNTYSSVALGTAATATAAARTINATGTGLVANVLKGDDAQATSATTLATNTVATVRTNGSFTAQVVAKDAASTPAVVAGVAVTGSVSTTATLRAATSSLTEISITVNGTKYTDASTLAAAAIALTTDASGVAKLNISSTGLTAGVGRITVSFSAQNLTAGVVVTEADAAYTITEGSTAGGYVTTPGATSALKYAVKDQFGVAITGGTYRVKAVVTGGSSNRTYYSAPVAAGAATISVVDAQTTTTTAASVVASLESQDSTTLNWSSASATGVTTAILYSTTANGFSTAPAIDATNGINNGAWTASGDQKQKITQSGIADLTANAAAGDTYAKLTFVAANQYQDVTVSGTGVYLALGATAPSADKLTFQAASGTTVIYVAANTIGTKTITFTSGATTKTVDVKFDTAGGTAARATAAKFAVAVPAAAQSGRAIDATVTVTDKWGNPVAGFTGTASVSGVAVVNGGYTAAVTTDANGQATVKLSAGVNDLGDAVVTFSDADSNTSTDVTSVAKTVTFGSTDGYIDVLNGKRASVTWSFAKGKRVAVYLDGVRRYNIVQPGDSELNLQFNLKKGSHSIKLVIGGVIVDTLSVKVAG